MSTWRPKDNTAADGSLNRPAAGLLRLRDWAVVPLPHGSTRGPAVVKYPTEELDDRLWFLRERALRLPKGERSGDIGLFTALR